MQCNAPITKDLLRFSQNNSTNTSSDQIRDDIARIKEWHEKQAHLNFVIDDQLIFCFLQCCKFSIERTKKKIDDYYTMRTFAPEMLSTRNPLSIDVQAVINAGVVLPLPKYHEDGSRIIMCNYSSNLNPNSMPCLAIIKVLSMVLDILLREDNEAAMHGLKIWAECQNCPLQYAKQATPSLLKKAIAVGEIGFPFRILGIYTTNCSVILESIYNLVKVFLSKKLTQRTFLYSENNIDQFYAKIPKKFLPSEFGGENGSIKKLTGIWKEKIESYGDFFLDNEKYKSDETLRENKSILDLDFVEGSFRKLTID